MTGLQNRWRLAALGLVAALVLAGCEESRTVERLALTTPTAAPGPTTAPALSPAPTATPSPAATASPTPGLAVVQAASPTPTATLTPTVRPTATPTEVPVTTTITAATTSPAPTALPEATEALLAQAAAVAGAEYDFTELEAPVQELQSLLERAVLAFAGEAGVGTNQLRELLEDRLDQIPSLPGPDFPSEARVVAADVDGDGADELLVGFHGMHLRAVFLDRVAGRWETMRLQPSRPFLAAEPVMHGFMSVARVEDLTGDGVADLVLTTSQFGASAVTTIVDAHAWRAGHPELVFSWPVVLWAGPASWELRTDGGPAEFFLTCTAFGTFDAKLIPHPLQMLTYRWDGARFSLVERVTQDPIDQRDQFNRAEAALERSEYVTASERYRAVIERPVLPEDDLPVNWSGFAHLRLGQIAALSGDGDEARRELAAAQAAGGTIAQLADAFLTAYGADGDPLRAFGALARLDLGGEFQAEPSNLDFPLTSGSILITGKAFEYFADSTGGPASADAYLEPLVRLGFPLDAVVVGDLDGDGYTEALVTVVRDPERPLSLNGPTSWFVGRHGSRWTARAISGRLRFGDAPVAVETLPSGQRVFVLADLSDPDQTGRRYLSWNGSQLAFWDDAPAPDSIADPPDSALLSPPDRCQVA